MSCVEAVGKAREERRLCLARSSKGYPWGACDASLLLQLDRRSVLGEHLGLETGLRMVHSSSVEGSPWTERGVAAVEEPM